MDLIWVEDFLPEGCLKKRMFGGFAYYLNEKLILVLFESEGNKSHRGLQYDFEIWNGCMFPVEKEKQGEVRSRFPFLINHPVLPKWFYLPMDSEDFESHAQIILRELRRRNDLFGTIPKPKKSKTKAAAAFDDRTDTRHPTMFRDELPEKRHKSGKKISDFRTQARAPKKQKKTAKKKSLGKSMKKRRSAL